MNNLEAIEQRISRRNYLTTPLDEYTLSILDNLITDLNKKSQLSIELLKDGSAAFNGLSKSYGMFNHVTSLIILKGSKNDPHLYEKAGYYGELIILEATKMGLGTCWVGGTFDRNSIPIDEMNEQIVCVITIGNVNETKSMKEKLIYKMVHRKTKPIKEMYVTDQKIPDWFNQAMKAVQKAPSARNTQKVMIAYKNDEIKASVPDTYSFDLVDLGIAKLHFELIADGTFMLGNHGVFSKE